MKPRAFLGIDGGGSETIARLEDGLGTAIFERLTGPTNPRTTPFPLVRERFDALLTGCPQPDALAVCLAGMRSREMRERIGGYFKDRFPATILRLEPDYAAAFRCFDTAPTACVLAGTGSMVCSRDSAGALVTTGGTGYLLGDQGSAFRVGRLLVARYVDDPGSVDELGPAICDALGVGGVDEIITAVYAASWPAALVAKAAPILCNAAGEGRAWALGLLSNEMSELANVVVTHLDRHNPARSAPVIGLVGGVWSSEAARHAFERALRESPGPYLTVVTARRSPVEAAVLLAREAA